MRIDKEYQFNISEIPESYLRYLNKIYVLAHKKRGGWVSNKELALILKVKPPSVTKMLVNLKENDLINWSPRRAIRLTKKGREIAMQLNEFCLILHKFFKNVLNIEDKETLDELSFEIEYHLTKEVKEPFKIFLTRYLENESQL
ncbi:MAG: metal-dependent transcriptional regulator [Candidatus Thorarchaeota archaeon]